MAAIAQTCKSIDNILNTLGSELKASSRGNTTIPIHSLEQLDAKLSHALRLVRSLKNTHTLIAKLPPEIMVYIFEFLVPLQLSYADETLNVFDYYEWVWATQVCRYWRDIALAAPRIWTNIFFDIDCREIAGIFIQRSGSHSLHLCTRDLEGFCDIFPDAAPRIRALRTARHDMPFGTLTSLKSLSICSHCQVDIEAPERLNYPALTSLRISVVLFQPTLFPYRATLTRLCLERPIRSKKNLRVQDFIRLMARCVMLEEFIGIELSIPNILSEHELPREKDRIRLPHLKRLALYDCVYRDEISSFLDLFNIPSVEATVVTARSRPRGTVINIKDVLPATLTSTFTSAKMYGSRLNFYLQLFGPRTSYNIRFSGRCSGDMAIPSYQRSSGLLKDLRKLYLDDRERNVFRLVYESALKWIPELPCLTELFISAEYWSPSLGCFLDLDQTQDSGPRYPSLKTVHLSLTIMFSPEFSGLESLLAVSHQNSMRVAPITFLVSLVEEWDLRLDYMDDGTGEIVNERWPNIEGHQYFDIRVDNPRVSMDMELPPVCSNTLHCYWPSWRRFDEFEDQSSLVLH